MRLLLATALGFSLAIPSALSADPSNTSIVVTSPWLRATPNGASVAGGYATITNKGATPDTLVAASIPMAPKGEIHSMSMDHGVMHMERLDKGLPIAPGATVTLTPGGFHMMFLKPTAQLKPGESVSGTLTFAKAGTVSVTFAVGGMAAKSAPGIPAPTDGMEGMDMKGMDMKGMDMKGMDMKGMDMKGH